MLPTGKNEAVGTASFAYLGFPATLQLHFLLLIFFPLYRLKEYSLLVPRLPVKLRVSTFFFSFMLFGVSMLQAARLQIHPLFSVRISIFILSVDQLKNKLFLLTDFCFFFLFFISHNNRHRKKQIELNLN